MDAAGRLTLPLQVFAERTVPDLLDRARVFGLDRDILLRADTGEALSYGAFLMRVAGAAQRLAARFPQGARIACLIANRVDYLILRYALSVAGLVEVAINGMHRDLVLRHMLLVSQPQAIFVADAFRENLMQCGYELSDAEVVLVDAA